jgi:hypothetical protein
MPAAVAQAHLSSIQNLFGSPDTKPENVAKEHQDAYDKEKK